MQFAFVLIFVSMCVCVCVCLPQPPVGLSRLWLQKVQAVYERGTDRDCLHAYI